MALAPVVKENHRTPEMNRTGVWTAGLVIHAPNRRREAASIKTLTNVPEDVDKDSLNYKTEAAAATIKDKPGFVLTSKSNQLILISRKRDSWSDEDIIAEIPSGTPVIFLKQHKMTLTPEVLLVRCCLRSNWEGKTIEGWAHWYNIKAINFSYSK